MSDFKQNITKFIKGMENKLYDKVKKASTETISQNALRDDKCTAIKRVAKNGCCPMCFELEGKHTKKEAKEKGVFNFHTNDGCSILPEFQLQAKEQKKAEEQAKTLLINARNHEAQTTPLLKSLENESIKLEGLDYRLKSKDSLVRKILHDTSSNGKGVSAKEASKNIKDVLRYTYVIDEKRFYNCFAEVRQTLEEKGYNLCRVKNSLKSKGVMYRGVNTVVKMPDGYLFELQFHTSSSLQIKETVHKFYEEYRQLNPTTKRAKVLEKQMIEISDSVAIPKGADKVKL